jgi:hypothetical protein
MDDSETARLLVDSAIELGKLAMQNWSVEVSINLAFLGWAVSSRREQGGGVPIAAVIVVAISLMLANLVFSLAGQHLQNRSDLALTAARAVIAGTSDAQALTLRALADTRMSDVDVANLLASARLWPILAINAFVALSAAVMLSGAGRKAS